MATISKPSTPGWQRVIARYHKVKSRYVSPYSLQAQTQLFSGDQWSFDLFLPPLTLSQAGAWKSFLHELARDNDNFSFVCANYVPAGVSSPMLVRLTGSDVSWDIDEMMFFGLNFSVEADI